MNETVNRDRRPVDGDVALLETEGRDAAYDGLTDAQAGGIRAISVLLAAGSYVLGLPVQHGLASDAVLDVRYIVQGLRDDFTVVHEEIEKAGFAGRPLEQRPESWLDLLRNPVTQRIHARVAAQTVASEQWVQVLLDRSFGNHNGGTRQSAGVCPAPSHEADERDSERRPPHEVRHERQ